MCLRHPVLRQVGGHRFDAMELVQAARSVGGRVKLKEATTWGSPHGGLVCLWR